MYVYSISNNAIQWIQSTFYYSLDWTGSCFALHKVTVGIYKYKMACLMLGDIMQWAIKSLLNDCTCHKQHMFDKTDATCLHSFRYRPLK